MKKHKKEATVSKSKKDIVSKFSSIPLQGYQPILPVEREVRNNGYWLWGEDNRFPEYLYSLVTNCATLQSILNGSITYTIGNGIMNNTVFQNANCLGESLEDVVNKMVVDRWYFGGCACQVLYNRYGEVVQIASIDFRKLRTNKTGSTIYLLDDWGGWGTNRAEKFHPFDLEKGSEENIQILYYKGQKTRGVYPVCDYNAALVSAETQIEIQEFNYNEIINNFSGTTIINFNNGNPTEPERERIEDGIIDKHTGSSNAGNVVLTFNQDKDHAVTIERLQTDDLDIRYNTLATKTRENLFVSLGAMPILFGIQDITGFNRQEYKDAFALYNRTRIKPVQREIERIIGKIFGRNDAIIFKAFDIDFTDEPENILTEDI